MVKVAILTMVSANYGNRLQNYAVQEVLIRMGYQPETLLRRKLTFIQRGKQLLRPFLKHDYFSKVLLFNRRIIWSRDIVSVDYISEGLENDYDMFVIGSDQVWNVTFDVVTENDFLPMIPSEKKMAFSASLGMSEVPNDKKEWLTKLLEIVPRISVREDAGAEIVKKLTGREAEVLIDPTMMLTSNEWRNLEEKPSDLKIGTPYILTYFLGDYPKEAKYSANQITREYGWKEYSLLKGNNLKSCKAGPCEFLYLVDHAGIVLTDSFHACVFSFLFGRPFLVYPREGKETGMMSRIDTLLGKFSLQRKLAGSGLKNDIFESDYTEGYKKLSCERDKALAFLQDAMSVLLK